MANIEINARGDGKRGLNIDYIDYEFGKGGATFELFSPDGELRCELSVMGLKDLYDSLGAYLDKWRAFQNSRRR